MSAVDAYRKEQSRLLKRRLLGRTALLLCAWTAAFALMAVVVQGTVVPRIAAEVESWCSWRHAETLDPELDEVFAARQREVSNGMIASYLRSVDGGDAAVSGEDVSDAAREALARIDARMQGDAADGEARGGEGATAGDAEDGGDAAADDFASDAGGEDSDMEVAASFSAAVEAELGDMREQDRDSYDELLDEALGFFGETRETAIVDMDSRGVMPGSYDWMVFLDGHAMWRDLTPYAVAHALKVPLAAATYVVGVVVIMWLAVRRAIGSFDRLFGAMEGVLAKRGETPDLPEELAPTSEALAAIAEQSRANEAAAQTAERRKNELVAYLAHDIRTPLTSVVGYLTMLKESPDMPSEQRARWAGIALDRACRLEGMLEEFFEITRYNLQSMPIERERIDAGILCRQVADELFPTAEARGIAVRVEAASPLPAFADAGKVSRVLNNLLKNAVGYAEEGSEVVLRARAEEVATAWEGAAGAPAPPAGYAPSVRELVVEVENRGREISPAHLQAIFEKFYREDASRSTGQGGAGLGLAIAREIARAHGGDLTARSEAGRTVFTLRIPA